MRKHIVTVVIVCIIGIPMLGVTWAGYQMWRDWYFKVPVLTPEQKREVFAKQGDEASERCMQAEAVEAGVSENDMLLVYLASQHESEQTGVGACTIFKNYTLLRAPSQGPGSAVRDASFVLDWKTWVSSKTSEKVGMAARVRERMLKGNLGFVGTDKIPPDVLKKMEDVKHCVRRINRVWATNTAGTDLDKMKAESNPSMSVTTPSGAMFFCLK